MTSFDRRVVPWNYERDVRWRPLASIQEKAGIRLCGTEEHEYTRGCHVYGFHDWRRTFAPMNADRLTADTLQKLMRHKCDTTRQGYLDLARQMNQAVANLHVPEVLCGQGPPDVSKVSHGTSVEPRRPGPVGG